MKKQYWFMIVMVALVAGLVLAVTASPALAAELSNLSGQSCGDAIGTWHFVNNQTGGAPAGTLTATFSSGTFITGASKVNASNQHFYVTTDGTLLGASTDLPGRLVLSDFTCGDVKEPPKK